MLKKMIFMCCAAIFLGVGSASAQNCDAQDRFERNVGHLVDFLVAYKRLIRTGIIFSEACEDYQKRLNATYSEMFRNNCTVSARTYAFHNTDDASLSLTAMDKAEAHCTTLAKLVDEVAYRNVTKCFDTVATERQRLETKIWSGEELTPEEKAVVVGNNDISRLTDRDCYYNVHKS